VSPEEALSVARAEAARMRAAGAYAGAELSRPGPPGARQLTRRLAEWAILDPDVSDVRSVRRWGAPITILKRGLLRLLWQYHAQLQSDQSRFNLLLLTYVEMLELRVAELEARVGEPAPLDAENPDG
jgi:hypothetical protein